MHWVQPGVVWPAPVLTFCQRLHPQHGKSQLPHFMQYVLQAVHLPIFNMPVTGEQTRRAPFQA